VFTHSSPKKDNFNFHITFSLLILPQAIAFLFHEKHQICQEVNNNNNNNKYLSLFCVGFHKFHEKLVIKRLKNLETFHIFDECIS
jgi:hypothetical protein